MQFRSYRHDYAEDLLPLARHPSKHDAQPDLPFATGQTLRNGHEGIGLGFLSLHGGGVGIVEQIEILEEALNLEALAYGPSLGYAQIHVYVGRRSEGVAAGF